MQIVFVVAVDVVVLYEYVAKITDIIAAVNMVSPITQPSSHIKHSLQGGPKKVSLIFFAITLSTAGQFS